MESSRWKIMTPSQYEWERRGLDFIRAGFPDYDPYRAWSNFEFQTDTGAIYEVDLLVLTKRGFWLVECKAWSGRIWGDAGSWRRTSGGKVVSVDNPVLLANRKAKALSSLLKAQPAMKGPKVPWLEAVVFLSADDVQCDLTGPARNRVFLQDRKAENNRPERKGILACLLGREGQGIDQDYDGTIDTKVANALSRAMEQAGIRPSQRSRRIGEYILNDLIADGPGYQDWLGKHVSVDDVFCRIRQYTVAQASSEEDRQRLRRAAMREFQLIRSLEHPNILKVLDYKEHENGPALLFEYRDPNAVRLDHYLATHADTLTTDQRLEMLRQISDAMRAAHKKRIIHRSLGPQSILVTYADSLSPRLQVYNWQIGVRDTTSNVGQATKVDDLVESQALVYMSPEAISDARKITEASDVFSLGALAYLLFASRPPAANPVDLAGLLREQKGLRISSVLDGTGQKLEELIQFSTHPDVLTRVGTVEDFLKLLEEVEDELTAPSPVAVVDPLHAKKGDHLEHGFVVERRLGQGATAAALLVTRNGKESVLKVALTEDDNARLRHEAKALKAIRSEFIVDLEDELTISGRTVLVLQKAGDRTLAQLLKNDGVPGLDLLARYGEDLLSAVASMERHGVTHRDIKPDNIGVRSLTKQRNQLILFDFSLASAPIENIHVGTDGYRDPFLLNRKPQRWDLAAERYSAAVTLYEMSLGAGVLPKWGSGKSHEALTDEALVLEAERFDASVREGMALFFTKAFDRDPDKRFHNAEEMLRAWNKIFEKAEERTITTTTGVVVELGVSVEHARLDTPISALGLSTRAQNALERANVLCVRDLLQFPGRELHLMKGVGNQTRQEIIAYLAKLKERFPKIEPIPVPETTTEDQPAGPIALGTLYQRILGTRSSRKDKDVKDWAIRTALLGVDAPARQPPHEWASQVDVAQRLGVTNVRVNQTLSADRKRWHKDAAVNALRHELCEQIQRQGGVVTIPEIIDLTLLIRPAADMAEEAGQLQRMASVVARAAVETEAFMEQPRYQIRRVAGKAVVACSQELASYADKLGYVADKLAAADPLLPPLRLFQELFEVAAPPQPLGCQPFQNDRLLKLAAAMSTRAAVSAKQELYPRNMPAERALRLAVNSLAALGLNEEGWGLSIKQIQERVASRYPEAEPLPPRPELDELLKKLGLDVEWSPRTSTFHRRSSSLLPTSGSSIPQRRSTATSTRHLEITPEVAEAREFEERLGHSFHEGGFLVLAVRPSRMRACDQELMHRFDLDRVSFDDLFFDALRREAEALEIEWSVIQDADGAGPESGDWKNLLHLAGGVAPKIVAELLGRPRHVLLVHAGLIARYDLMSILEQLRDGVGREGKCPGLWVLVAMDGQTNLPVLDHAAIPVITPGQRAKVSEAWIDNVHRGKAEGERRKAEEAIP